MSVYDAWQQIFRLSSGEWQVIPPRLRAIVGLPSNVGIMGSVLCTRASADGITQLVNRLNSISERQGTK